MDPSAKQSASDVLPRTWGTTPMMSRHDSGVNSRISKQMDLIGHFTVEWNASYRIRRT
jgi:hypothetical protein